MTLVVGFVANDRAVMAADSQGTEADGTRTTVEKIWCERGLLFGYAGPQAIRDNLRDAFSHVLAPLAPEQLRDRREVEQTLCGASKVVLEATYENFARDGERDDAKSVLAGQLIVIGCESDGKHWLLEVDRDNTSTNYSEQGFHAAGSGSPAAQVAMALLEAYVPDDLTLIGLRALAYRTVSAAIRVLAEYLSEPVVLWFCDPDVGFRKATASDVDDIERWIEAWLTLEREAIRNAGRPATPQTPGLPKPITNS